MKFSTIKNQNIFRETRIVSVLTIIQRSPTLLVMYLFFQFYVIALPSPSRELPGFLDFHFEIDLHGKPFPILPGIKAIGASIRMLCTFRLSDSKMTLFTHRRTKENEQRGAEIYGACDACTRAKEEERNKNIKIAIQTQNKKANKYVKVAWSSECLTIAQSPRFNCVPSNQRSPFQVAFIFS